MTIIKDRTNQQENTAVAGILLHLKKREERRQRFLWAITIFALLIFVLLLLLFIIVAY